jgi:nucleotide-binding universal stress UspA family protein
MLDSNSRILVPFDATELSIRALEEAKEVALKSRSMITLLYVIDDACLSPPGIKDYIAQIKDFDSSKQNYLSVLSRGAELMINKKVEEMNQQGINAKLSVKIGNPADEILAVARDERSDLIIMGSSGSLKKLHERKGIGSVSRWVSDIAECPVSLIR